MSLTDHQKFKIYEEEKRKREESKLKNLTEEERLKIYKEIEEKNDTHVLMKDIVYPKRSSEVYYWIMAGIFIILVVINLFAGAIWLFIAFIITIILRRYNIINLSVEIKYNCPKCSYQDVVVLERKKQRELEKNRYLKESCPNCDHNFKLLFYGEMLEDLGVE